MGELNLLDKAPERKPRTTNSQHSFPRYQNLVKHLKIKPPDQLWVADITNLVREHAHNNA